MVGLLLLVWSIVRVAPNIVDLPVAFAQFVSRETATARDRLRAISARATTVLTQTRISEAPNSLPNVSQINILQHPW